MKCLILPGSPCAVHFQLMRLTNLSYRIREEPKKTNEMGLHSLILSTDIAVYLETYTINLV